ncbi:MAG: DUF2971 domain-containing protein [Paludibacter sp.]|nr:DUF2971 domain-containing protein [Paludibacter sp.]
MDKNIISDYIDWHQYMQLLESANATFKEAIINKDDLKMKEASDFIDELVTKFENVISCKANLKTDPIVIDYITNKLVEDAKVFYPLAGQIWSYLDDTKSMHYFRRYQYCLSQIETDFQGNEEKGVVVYSFRVCNNYTYADLANDTITLVRPKCMNDPFDSLVMMWLDENNLRHVNIDNKSEKYSKHLRNLAKSYQYYRIRSFCANTDTMKSDNTIPQNILMWSHYANGHKGICVKYRLKNDFVGSKRKAELNKPYVCLKKIVYGEEPNEIVDLNVPKMSIATGFLRKDYNWSYENEVRLISYNADCEEDFIALPMKENAEIEAIYFGYKCTETEKEIVKKLTQNSKIMYYNMEPNFNDVFKLKIKRHSSKND